MRGLDKVIFGDNQFFGINHMSQEKAQQLAEKFFDNEAIFRVYQNAIDAGINGFMLNSNDRASAICEFFRQNSSKYGHLNWYPSIPYPHKYANLVAEKGIVSTLNDVLFKGNTTKGVMNMVTKGGAALLGKDAIKMMEMLIDIEMRMFAGLNVKVVFLQNIITDLILGYDLEVFFVAYCEFIRKKYNAYPGLITQNMPRLKSKLEVWGIDEVVICSSFNKIGYLTSPSRDEWIKASENNDPEKYYLMAMSTLASGAISAPDAYQFINSQNIQSVVFGASSKKNIDQTVSLIDLA